MQYVFGDTHENKWLGHLEWVFETEDRDFHDRMPQILYGTGLETDDLRPRG